MPKNIKVTGNARSVLFGCDSIDFNQLAATIAKAVNGNCATTPTENFVGAISAMKYLTPYTRKGQAVSEAVLRHVSVPSFLPLNDSNRFATVGKEISVQYHGIDFAAPLRAIPDEYVVGRRSYAAAAGASAGTGLLFRFQPLPQTASPILPDGFTGAIVPVLGYLMKFRWTADDIGDALRLTVDFKGQRAVSLTVQPTDLDCYELVCFVPASSGFPTPTRRGTSFPWVGFTDTLTADSIFIDGTLFVGGTAKTDLGSWSAEVMPIYLTGDVIDALVPHMVGNEYSRLPANEFV